MIDPKSDDPHPVNPAPESARHVNSVDATIGQPLIARVMARKAELESLLAALPSDDVRTRGDITLALTTIEQLMTGDLEHVPAVVAADMNRWLEHNKHLAESAGATGLANESNATTESPPDDVAILSRS